MNGFKGSRRTGESFVQILNCGSPNESRRAIMVSPSPDFRGLPMTTPLHTQIDPTPPPSVRGLETIEHLTSTPRSGTVLQTPEECLLAQQRSDSPMTPAGYSIIRELGRGGMGVVYQALQTKLQRIVALKMILAGGHAGSELLERFRVEAEAIARLDHPNIVQIHEVGEYQDLPFFSLEFCGGGALDKKLSANPLPAREAAAIVEQLARAMSAAHQKGILHRDLKPANVLFSDDGIPKITDFGLAKKMDDETKPNSERSNLTHTNAIMGTPSYMAPEQAMGESKKVGPAADIYALGAIFYECLTGRPPFRAASVLETLDQVRSQDPVPPRQLNASIPRDLETICLKCLRKEPGRRYPSAHGLAEDLHCYLEGMPIQARPVRLPERLWKLARRNRLWSAFIVLLTAAAVAIVVLVAVYTAQLKTALNGERAQREQAQENLETAFEAIDSAFLRIGEKHLDTVPGMQKFRRELLAAALPHLNKLLSRYEGDPKLRVQSASLNHRIGEMYVITAEPKIALAHLERASSIRRSLVEENPDDPQRLTEEAATRRAIGNMLLAQKGRESEGRFELHEALRLREKAHKLNSENEGLRYDLAESLMDVARVYKNQAGQSREVGPLVNRSIGLLSALPINNVPARRLLAAAYNQLGGITADFQDKEQALEHFNRGIGIRRALYESDPNNIPLRHDLAWSYNDAGWLLVQLGRPREALAYFEDSLNFRIALAEDAPVVVDFQHRLASAYNNIGWTRMNLVGSSDPAITHFEQALKIRRRLALQAPDNLDNLAPLGHIRQNLAILKSSFGRKQEAIEFLREVMKIREQVLGQGKSHTSNLRHLAYTRNLLGDLLTQMGEFEEAERELLEAKKVRLELIDKEKTNADLKDDLLLSQMAIASLLIGRGKARDALAFLEEAVKAAEARELHKTSTPEHLRHFAQLRMRRGELSGELTTWSSALPDFLAALKAAEDVVRIQWDSWENQDVLADARHAYAVALHKNREFDASIAQFTLAEKIRRSLSEANPNCLDLLSAHGRTLTAWGLACRESGMVKEGNELLKLAEARHARAAAEAPKVPVYQQRLLETRRLIEQNAQGRSSK
ncbi:MAG: serine/threonine-protein kinase [Planctomycetes bacterium]|nr:serine/threonine-protein kinase [Planctomycetota bacterium]